MVLKLLTNYPLRSKENTHSPKQATKREVYFYHLFFKVLHWTLEMRLWQPWENVSVGNPMFPFNDRKLSYKYFCFQKNFWKWSIAQVGYRFQIHAPLFCWKTKFLFHKVQNWLIKQIFQVNFPILFLSARWSVVWQTWLKHFAKKKKKSRKLQNW